jgi:hypothetical protein
LQVVCGVLFILAWLLFSVVWASWILGEGCFEVDDCGSSGLEKAVAVVQFLVALPGFVAGGFVNVQRARLVLSGRLSDVTGALKVIGLSVLAWGLVLLGALWGPV